MRLTEHFTLEELSLSETARRLGIDNTPTASVTASLKALCLNVLEPLRIAWGAPVVVTSGYRCKALNRAVGSKDTSQHVKGEAADIRTLSDSPKDNRRLYGLIKELGLPVDQCINEYGYNWIHVSYGPKRRGMYFDLP